MAPGRRMIPSCAMAGIAGGAGGGGGPTITLTSTTVFDSGFGSQNAIYRVDADGSVYKDPGGVFENWISDPASAGLYEVRATLDSGTTPTGASLGVWLALSTDRAWAINNSAEDGSEVSCVLTVEIRDAATSTVRATATVTLSATSL